ncbi:hypothetical protein [Streptomyces lincolnensis]|uniref:hypothetical protein n=1 Tax=Streptomyces lincolnensis TaxID=1915 RepID=UPI000832145A|nr:hypothetical protein [Streptomyces lincolnensis]
MGDVRGEYTESPASQPGGSVVRIHSKCTPGTTEVRTVRRRPPGSSTLSCSAARRTTTVGAFWPRSTDDSMLTLERSVSLALFRCFSISL